MPARYLLMFGAFLLTMLLYIDRACITVAKEDISVELGLTDTEMSWVMAAFALGYALCQVPAGIIADRYGPRRTLSAIVIIWSLFTAMTGMVHWLWTLFTVRLLFGAGEAGAFPGAARAFFSWLPLTERGIAQGINASGSRFGAAIALPGVTWLVATHGWRQSFLILGAIGVVWAIAWFLLFRDDPADHPMISERERDHILRERQQPDPGQTAPRLSAREVFGSKNMWLIMGQYFASNFTFFFCLSWFFPYLKDRYDLEFGETGWYAMVPFLGGMVGNWVSGALVDMLYRSGRWTISRRIPAIIGFGLAAVGIIGSLYSDGVGAAVAWLTVAIFGADMTLSPSWSTCTDIGKRNTGAVSGTMNMAGNLGSFITSLAFAYLKEWTGNTDPYFIVAAALNLVAIGLWLFIRPERALEEY